MRLLFTRCTDTSSRRLARIPISSRASLVLRPHADRDHRVAELARLQLAISSCRGLGRPRGRTGAALQDRGGNLAPHTQSFAGDHSPMATIIWSQVNHRSRADDQLSDAPQSRPFAARSFVPTPQCPPTEGLAACLLPRKSDGARTPLRSADLNPLSFKAHN